MCWHHPFYCFQHFCLNFIFCYHDGVNLQNLWTFRRNKLERLSLWNFFQPSLTFRLRLESIVVSHTHGNILSFGKKHKTNVKDFRAWGKRSSLFLPQRQRRWTRFVALTTVPEIPKCFKILIFFFWQQKKKKKKNRVLHFFFLFDFFKYFKRRHD